MLKKLSFSAAAVGVCLAGLVAAAPSAGALPVDPCEVWPDTCAPPTGGGGGGTTPVYQLQGVIQVEGYDTDSAGFKHAKIRGYSRFANSGNDRVDADYLNVRCYAYGPGSLGPATDYDSENGGALVDVHFWSNGAPRGAAVRTVTVQCTHHAEYRGVVYDTTSSAQVVIPY